VQIAPAQLAVAGAASVDHRQQRPLVGRRGADFLGQLGPGHQDTAAAFIHEIHGAAFAVAHEVQNGKPATQVLVQVFPSQLAGPFLGDSRHFGAHLIQLFLDFPIFAGQLERRQIQRGRAKRHHLHPFRPLPRLTGHGVPLAHDGNLVGQCQKAAIVQQFPRQVVQPFNFRGPRLLLQQQLQPQAPAAAPGSLENLADLVAEQCGEQTRPQFFGARFHRLRRGRHRHFPRLQSRWGTVGAQLVGEVQIHRATLAKRRFGDRGSVKPSRSNADANGQILIVGLMVIFHGNAPLQSDFSLIALRLCHQLGQ